MFKLIALLSVSLAVASPATMREVTETNPAVATTSFSAQPTAPTAFNITSVDMNGSGCPPGSGQAFLNGIQYAVSAGPGVPISENRKNCQLTLSVHVPSGLTFAIMDVDYRGYYQLDTGVKGYHSAIYYFQGQVVQGESRTTINGPVDGDDITYRDEFNLTPTVYAPCGQDSILNLNSQVRVDNSGNKSGSGYFGVDATMAHTYNFAWVPCP